MKYTAKIINFELLYTTSDTANLTELTYEHVIQQLTIASKEGCDTIIGLLLIDGFLYKDNEKFYNLLYRVQEYAIPLGIINLKLVAGMAEQYQHKLDNRGLKFEIIFWDFNVNMVYQSYKDKRTATWNSDADKFLFLGGIPSRHNRITLLYKMYKSKLLSSAIWSFFKPWTDGDKEWCRRALPVDDYDAFLNDCDRSIDTLYDASKDYSKLNGKEIKDSNIHNTKWCQDPSWIDPELFESAVFSVISEGNVYEPGNDYRFLTEKTWRTIVNRHPFILAGDPEQFRYLESKDIATFKEYLKIPRYAEISSELERFNAIITNVIYFLTSFKLYRSDIEKDIEHNYRVFVDQVKRNQIILDHFELDYNISKAELDKWFNQKSFVHLTSVIEL